MNATAIILAAGGSSRLGKPKQLVRIEGESLRRRAVHAAADSLCDRVIVVTGAAAEACTGELSGVHVSNVFNPQWADGLSTSIHAGVSEALLAPSSPDVLVLMLCDQPYVSASTIDTLLHRHSISNRGIVASRYAETPGPPVLFAKEYFPDLLALRGDSGARSLFARFGYDCEFVSFPKGACDIDSPSDLQALESEVF